MAAYFKFNAFVADIANKVHNLGADALKVLLSNTAIAAANAVKADLTEIAAGNGYAAGGGAVTVTGSTQAAGLYTLAANQVVTTAAGGTIGPLRYAVIYNSTPVAGPLIGGWDYGSSITLQIGETFTVQFNSANPGAVLTIQ